MGSLDRAPQTEHRLVTRQQALAAGMSPAAIRHQLATTRHWTYALRGVYAMQSGGLTTPQRWAAALAYGGEHALLGGPTAAALHGLRAVPRTNQVHLLLPHRVRRTCNGFVVVRRSLQMPEPWLADEWRAVPVARAVVDSCRGMTRIGDVRALLAESVQRRRTTVAALCHELDLGAKNGSRLARAVLEEVADGIRSASEGQARDIVLASSLPSPIWNADLFTIEGEWLCCTDGWWTEAGMALEVDSKRWHLSPESWQATQERHARMTSYGILVVHVAPHRLAEDSRSVTTELVRCYQTGRDRGGAPAVTDVPPPAWRRG